MLHKAEKTPPEAISSPAISGEQSMPFLIILSTYSPHNQSDSTQLCFCLILPIQIEHQQSQGKKRDCLCLPKCGMEDVRKQTSMSLGVDVELILGIRRHYGELCVPLRVRRLAFRQCSGFPTAHLAGFAPWHLSHQLHSLEQHWGHPLCPPAPRSHFSCMGQTALSLHPELTYPDHTVLENGGQ